ncbi:MAG: hypothetical protein KGJ90_04070 [Patescibacteria group bacterium]|nr:hypothetical protein [Patescibacteria group bacterium]
MANSPRDNNFVTGKLAVLNTDTVQGQNLVPIRISSVDRGILNNTLDTISFTMAPISPKDGNYVNCWLFQGTDGKTYPAVANSSGELLIDQT